GMDFLKKAEKDGDISEDDQRKRSDQVQKLTDETISTIDHLLSDKEAEIMQV
ncbi:ribosome recycling factor, partial [Mesorhizobium sp. M7A.T.Ca.TU.009.02.1.1]